MIIRRGQCSSDASIAVGYSHSGEGGSYEPEELLDQVIICDLTLLLNLFAAHNVH